MVVEVLEAGLVQKGFIKEMEFYPNLEECVECLLFCFDRRIKYFH